VGQVRLIPPMVSFQRTYQNSGMGFPNGQGVVYPVQFAPFPVYSGGSGGGYVPNESSSLHAHVTVPIQTIVEELYNPVQAAVELYGLGYLRDSQKIVRKTKRVQFDPVFHSVSGIGIGHMFWDFQDIEDYVKSWVGDLLVTINTNNMSGNSISQNAQWGFCVTRSEDTQRLQDMLVRRKSLNFQCAASLRAKYVEWLDQNTTEYEFIEDCSKDFDKEDLLYIRSDTEAVHFKMRWFGVKLEDEIELENEE
jgi:hypothetical protein